MALSIQQGPLSLTMNSNSNYLCDWTRSGPHPLGPAAVPPISASLNARYTSRMCDTGSILKREKLELKRWKAWTLRGLSWCQGSFHALVAKRSTPDCQFNRSIYNWIPKSGSNTMIEIGMSLTVLSKSLMISISVMLCSSSALSMKGMLSIMLPLLWTQVFLRKVWQKNKLILYTWNSQQKWVSLWQHVMAGGKILGKTLQLSSKQWGSHSCLFKLRDKAVQQGKAHNAHI